MRHPETDALGAARAIAVNEPPRWRNMFAFVAYVRSGNPAVSPARGDEIDCDPPRLNRPAVQESDAAAPLRRCAVAPVIGVAA